MEGDMKLKAKMILFVLVAGVCLIGTSCDGGTVSYGSVEISASQCQDSVDNDADGATDCADTDCQGFVFCVDGGVGSCDCDDAGCSDCCDDGGIGCLPCCDDDGGNCDDDGGVYDECIEGNYTIENSVDAHVIRNFSCITGDLTVNAPGLISLDLPNLESVGGNLLINGNQDLQNIDGLSSLKAVGGDMNFYQNTGVINIDGFSSLKAVGGHMFIQNNIHLQNVNGLSSLETVGGNMQIRTNWELTCDATALEAQIDVTGGTIIENNAPCDGCGPSVCP
jgi:hypothetical protein